MVKLENKAGLGDFAGLRTVPENSGLTPLLAGRKVKKQDIKFVLKEGWLRYERIF